MWIYSHKTHNSSPSQCNTEDSTFIHSSISLTHRKHLHDDISSIRGDVLAHKASLNQLSFIKVPLPSQESERSCICVLWVSILPLYTKKKFTRLAAASDKVYQLLAQGRWFSLGTPASSTTKTGRHDIAGILLKVALNTKIHSFYNFPGTVLTVWYLKKMYFISVSSRS